MVQTVEEGSQEKDTCTAPRFSKTVNQGNVNGSLSTDPRVIGLPQAGIQIKKNS